MSTDMDPVANFNAQRTPTPVAQSGRNCPLLEQRTPNPSSSPTGANDLPNMGVCRNTIERDVRGIPTRICAMRTAPGMVDISWNLRRTGGCAWYRFVIRGECVCCVLFFLASIYGYFRAIGFWAQNHFNSGSSYILKQLKTCKNLAPQHYTKGSTPLINWSHPIWVMPFQNGS